MRKLLSTLWALLFFGGTAIGQSTITIPKATGAGIKYSGFPGFGMNVGINQYFAPNQFSSSLYQSNANSMMPIGASATSYVSATGTLNSSTQVTYTDANSSSQPTGFWANWGAHYSRFRYLSGANAGVFGTITASTLTSGVQVFQLTACTSGANGCTSTSPIFVVAPLQYDQVAIQQAMVNPTLVPPSAELAGYSGTLAWSSDVPSSSLSSNQIQSLDMAPGASFSQYLTASNGMLLNGTYTFSIIAKGVATGAALSCSVEQNSNYINNVSIPLTINATSGAGWQVFNNSNVSSLQFTTAQTAQQTNALLMTCSVSGAHVRIQSPELIETEPSGTPAGVRNAVFQKEGPNGWAPGLMRFMSTSSSWGCPVESLLYPESGRAPCVWGVNAASNSGFAQNGGLPMGINDDLQWALAAQATPVIQIAADTQPEEMAAVWSFLNDACAETMWSALRCLQNASTATWTSQFPNGIYLEIGNESWNSGNSQAGFVYPNRWSVTSGTATSGSSTITLSSSRGVYKGAVVGGTGIQYGTVVTANPSGNVITVSPATTGAVSGAITIDYEGSGGWSAGLLAGQIETAAHALSDYSAGVKLVGNAFHFGTGNTGWNYEFLTAASSQTQVDVIDIDNYQGQDFMVNTAADVFGGSMTRAVDDESLSSGTMYQNAATAALFGVAVMVYEANNNANCVLNSISQGDIYSYMSGVGMGTAVMLQADLAVRDNGILLYSNYEFTGTSSVYGISSTSGTCNDSSNTNTMPIWGMNSFAANGPGNASQANASLDLATGIAFQTEESQFHGKNLILNTSRSGTTLNLPAAQPIPTGNGGGYYVAANAAVPEIEELCASDGTNYTCKFTNLDVTASHVVTMAGTGTPTALGASTMTTLGYAAANALTDNNSGLNLGYSSAPVVVASPSSVAASSTFTVPAGKFVMMNWTDPGSTPTAAAPVFSPAAGSYTSAQTVAMTTTTSGGVIHYTTDGSTPTSASATYSAPITVSATETLKAITIATGYTNSAVTSGTYTITGTTVTFTVTIINGKAVSVKLQ